ncbi:hypothetical protein KHU50_008007 [Colletotrichum sp. SAR 10_65]|nr:hypothetical protein KHU50_008007 [Colletotrichum sp. SAR 10_65]KAI8175483.1 hypothetical protein K4K51_007411 [Colletotrichum sp. SAR 10_75]KAI8219154.1 hypothetical protein K4K53_008435 [Colletotrichum sp. SAR 10_77]
MQASQERIAEKTAAKVVREQKVLHQLSEDRIARRISFDVSTQLASITRQLSTLEDQQVNKRPTTEYVIVRSESTWKGVRLPSYRPTATGKLATKASKERNEWNVAVQLPAWISRAVWEVQLCWSIAGGWQQSLRSFSVRSQRSAIFSVVNEGDVNAMMGMFSKGEASPLDRDEQGASLLYYATSSEQVETCKTLLDLGLENFIDDKDATSDPLSTLVMSRKNLAAQDDPKHRALVSLFQSRSDKIETLGIERMFEFETECSYGDDWLRVFRRHFLPDYYDMPLRERAEALRLGAFTTQDVKVYRALIRQDGHFVQEDVRESTEAGFSLVHSAALALGKRFADEMQFDPRLSRDLDEDESSDDEDASRRMPSMIRMKSYHDGWSYAVVDTIKTARLQDLHSVETVVPWDWYRVPVWTGTPLVSLIGGALCRMSPDIPYPKWDIIFHCIIRQWLRDLEGAGIDLLQYGRGEALKLKFTAPQVKGAFDADAILASRRHVRAPLRMREAWMQAVDLDHPRSDLYWLPVRIVGLDYGPQLRQWRLWWAPEFEVFAAEFWAGVERPREVMPGSWVDS